MTIKQALTLIRALGIPASYNSHSKEFRIGAPEPYYTDNRYDAVYTALDMADRRRHSHISVTWSHSSTIYVTAATDTLLRQ